MKSKNSEDIDKIAVIGVDIGKDTFHLVGFDEAGRLQRLLTGKEATRKAVGPHSTLKLRSKSTLLSGVLYSSCSGLRNYRQKIYMSGVSSGSCAQFTSWKGSLPHTGIGSQS